jgi:type VI secretion system lysozyme-like protein
MAHESSLLERIAAGRRETKIDLDPALVAESVLKHLERLFNVRQGNVATRQDYGLPDINSLTHQFPDAGVEFRKAIKLAIDEFEPRLRNTTVTADSGNEDDMLRLRFKITAKLVAKGMKRPVNFTTQIDDDGKFRVTE